MSMAVFDHFENMYDIKLKPRLLRSLTKEYLPDDDTHHSIPSLPELSKLVSAIKTHGLLSESFPQPLCPKLIDNWKSSIDVWVDRLLSLVSSDMPDKCWVGICLLGVTCLECSSDRFLASYTVWLHELVSHLQPPSESNLVKVASCASMSDMFTRLGGYSNVKKDGTSHAGKLIQPVLKMLNEDSSDAAWEGAVGLLCTIITFFPSSIHSHYDSAEAAIVSKIMSGRFSVNMLKKFAHCLALLPKSRGDEDSWSLMMQKILILINLHLTEAFQGLEEETICHEAIRLLVPPGKDLPAPLGCQTMSGGASDQAMRGSEMLLISRVPALMLCCCTMLTIAYPVQVSVPVLPLLTLVGRVLMVDGSLSQTLLPFMTVMQQEFICSELPMLHLYSLDLLTAIIKGVRRFGPVDEEITHGMLRPWSLGKSLVMVSCGWEKSLICFPYHGNQLLPHAAEIVRLLTEYFRRCALPALRIKVYSIFRLLLISMGVGMALYIAPEVISNAFVDLDSAWYGSGRESSSACSKFTTEALLQRSHKKRKHVTTTGSLEEHWDGVGSEVEGHGNNPTSTSLKIAALETLEALLTVGGALKSECWGSNLDLLLITVATNACDGECARKENSVFVPPNEPPSSWEDFQLSVLRALLASLLSSARVRPCYLSQGLELFRKGKQETGTKLAEFCAHALLALEVLMHPRFLPLVDFPSADHGSFNEGFNSRFPEIVFSGGQKKDALFSRFPLGKDDCNPDDMYDSWLGNGNDIEAPPNIKYAEELSKTHVQQGIKDLQAENLPIGGVSFGAKIPEESEQGQAVSVHVEMGRTSHEIMVEQFSDPIYLEGVKVPTGTVSEIQFRKVVTDGGVFDPANNEMTPGKNILAGAYDGSKTDKDTCTTISVAGKAKGLVFGSDNESSMDSLPDILDADPDSD